MKRVILVHGWDGSSNSDWLPWLANELKQIGFEVINKDFPHTENPTIEDWVPFLSEMANKVDENTYFIGGSIGCQTILRYLETINSPIGGALFVSGWFDLKNLEDEEVEKIAKPWIETPINIEKITTVLPKSTLIISDNDPYDAFEENKNKFAQLGSKIVVLHNAGHITEDDGYKEAPILVEEFKELIK